MRGPLIKAFLSGLSGSLPFFKKIFRRSETVPACTGLAAMTYRTGLIYLTAGLIVTSIIIFPDNSFSAGAVRALHVQSIYSDDKGTGLKHPEGVACNEQSAVIVADTENGRLLRYTYTDNSVTEIRISQLPYPVVVRLNSKGDIYTLDGKTRRIVRLGPDGRFNGYLEPSGIPSPSAFVPRSFAIDRDDNIFVLDIFYKRVLVLDPEGALQRTIQFPEGYGFFSDVAVDFKGNVLIIDSINARVYSAAKNAQVFSPLSESLKKNMRFPAGIATDSRGRIYLVDRNGSRIMVVGQDGSFLGQLSERGWKEGLLNYPSQMCINDNGDVYIADTDNNRVQIFTLVK